MAIYPLQVFTGENAGLNYGGEYRSSALGKKFAGTPKGIYVGLTPSNTPPNTVLTLAVDLNEGYSLIKLPSAADPAGLDIILKADVTLDLGAVPDGDFPVDIVVRASYVDDPTVPTSAEIIARSAGTLQWSEVRVCRINGTSANMVIDASTAFGIRTIPLALAGAAFGFMPAGSIEALQQATDIVNEMIAARVDLTGAQTASLGERLAVDQSAEAMARRLALVHRVLRSNDYVVDPGVDNIIVSGSFSEISREHRPLVTLGGLGHETTAGALSAPNDTGRNVCLVQDAVSGRRPISGPDDRRGIFGRLEGPEELVVRGEWTFVNASSQLTSEDGSATEDLVVGDTIQGPDGKFYEVEAITNDTLVLLKNAYTGATMTAGNLIGHRWMLWFKKINTSTGAEEAASFSVPTTIRFFFSAFLDVSASRVDYARALHTSAEPERVATATTSTRGVGVSAGAGNLLGQVEIQNAGVPLAGGPFHTINFVAAEANVSSPATGEIDVVEIGPKGPTGPAGSVGAQGPQGAQGPGFSAINTFELSGDLAGPGNAVPVSRSFTIDMGHNIRILTGGIALWRDLGGFTQGFDIINITNISKPSPTVGQIDVTMSGDNICRLFLSSAGD